MTEVADAVKQLAQVLTNRKSTTVDDVLCSQITMREIRRAVVTDLSAVLPTLIDLLGLQPPRRGGLAAMCCAAAVEAGVDASIVAAPVMECATPLLKSAGRFWGRINGDLPSRIYVDEYRIGITDDWLLLDEELIDHRVRQRGVGPAAFQALDLWCLAVLTCLSPSAELRRSLGSDELARTCERLGKVNEPGNLLSRLLRVVDDEPLIVMHPTAERAFMCRISGTSTIDQLHVLMADALAGGSSTSDFNDDRLPGTRPNSHAVSVASGGTRDRFVRQAPASWEFFQWPAILFGAQHSELSREYSLFGTDMPSEIWSFDDVRTVLLGPRRYPRTLSLSREFDLLPASFRVERPLSPGEYRDLWRKLIKDALRRKRDRERQEAE